MAQRGRKSAVLLSFLIPVEFLAEINAAVARQNRLTLLAPLNRSEWIRRALRWELDRAIRARKTRPRKRPAASSAPSSAGSGAGGQLKMRKSA